MAAICADSVWKGEICWGVFIYIVWIISKHFICTWNISSAFKRSAPLARILRSWFLTFPVHHSLRWTLILRLLCFNWALIISDRQPCIDRCAITAHVPPSLASLLSPLSSLEFLLVIIIIICSSCSRRIASAACVFQSATAFIGPSLPAMMAMENKTELCLYMKQMSAVKMIRGDYTTCEWGEGQSHCFYFIYFFFNWPDLADWHQWSIYSLREKKDLQLHTVHRI